ISKVFETNYFLRLGTRNHNLELIDKLNLIINEVNYGGRYIDKSNELNNAKQRFNGLMDERANLESQLDSISKFEKALPILEEEILIKKSEYQNWLASLNKNERELYIDKNLKYDISQSTLNEVSRILVKSQKGWFANKRFNWFNRASVLKTLKEINNDFPKEIREYIDANAPMTLDTGDEVKGYEKHV